MKTKLRLHLLLLTLLSLSGSAYAQGTAIGYQGHLNDGSRPATGLYDFNFKVFAVQAGGTALAATVVSNAVPVTNGVFSLSLDFGAGVFTGAARWLEISVRTNGLGALSILTPRTPLLPTPYAIFAGSVANGTVTANQLNTVGPAPAPGQFLSYDGGNLAWTAPGVAAGNIWSTNGSTAYYNAGRVGIGTAGPLTPLEVNGIVRSTRSGVASQHIQLNGGDSGSIKLTAQSLATAEKNLFIQNLSGEATAGANNNIRFELGTTAAPSTKMTITRNGAVGIGTVSPQSLLHMYEPGGAVSHLIETGGGIDAWAKVAFKNLGGQWDIGTSRGFQGDAFYVDRLGTSPLEFLLAPNGNLGLGIYPLAKLDIYDPAGSVSHRIGTGGGDNAWTRVEFANGNGQWNVGTSRGFNLDQLYFAREGAAPVFSIQPNGDAFVGGTMSCRVLTIRGGADVAEPFAMPEEIAKGSVVVIDDAHPGQLKLSAEAYDTRVAGIVSGANGINPGIALHQEGVVEGGQNVALSGRVYVQADAAFGAIKPGDLLTTSDTPGHAMKVTEPGKAQGAILGKAMSELKAGKGMVLVLVTLQ